MTRRSGLWLLLIVVAAAVLRFTGLAWGAPYFHFHIDEHFVTQPADALRHSLRAAFDIPKFFMYGTLPMWILDGVRWVYERFHGALVLSIDREEVIYMVMSRAISAALGTATVAIVFAIARRVAGQLAGLLAAFLLAVSVVHLRESHFYTVDVTMAFFCALTWLFSEWIVERGRLRDYVFAGLATGAAVASKYSALFLFGVIAVAHLFARRPTTLADRKGWLRWVGRGVTPIVITAAVFIAANPMALMYRQKFVDDIRVWIIKAGSAADRPIFTSQFADVAHLKLYWFTNLLWWGLGPALEVAGLLGVVWLLVRRSSARATSRAQSWLAASFPILYYVAASQTAAPHMRYLVPFAVGLAVAAGVFCADLISRPRIRAIAIATTAVVCLITTAYAIAFMHIFLAPDSRLTAAQWVYRHVPKGARVLVEPSQNVVPMGEYRTHVDFNRSYVPFADLNGGDPAGWEARNHYDVHVLDTYRYLYHPGIDDRQNNSEQYLNSRLALADWIVMDDTFTQFYEHLPESTHGVTKRYYRELFAGRLGFQLVQTFKVYPKLFGYEINDDEAELSFRLFDHPRIYIFHRQ